MSDEMEIALAVFFAFAGITLITVFAILQWKKPTPPKSRTSEKSPVLLSVLFVLFIVLASAGFMVALIGIVLHPLFAVLGVALCVVSIIIVVILNKTIGSFDESTTESRSNYTNGYQKQSTAYTWQYSRPVSDGEKNYDLLEKVRWENVLKYSYENNLCLSGDGYMHLAGNGGKTLKFVQEPNNPYDSGAVAIYLGTDKLGYVYRDQVQKMINDWIRRGEYFTGYLNKFSVADKKATFKIGFYKPLSRYPSKTYSLVRTGKKIDDFDTRADNLLECDVGDCVSISSLWSDSYVVFQYGSTAEIGELPKNAENFLNGYEDEDIIGIIREIDDENETAPKAKVEIYVTG